MDRIRPLSPKKLVQVFKHFGFRESRQSGSHLSLVKDGISRPLIIPMHTRDVPVFVILNNIRSAGISREDYLKALGEV